MSINNLTFRTRPRYNIGWFRRTFGIMWDSHHIPKEWIFKAFKWASPVMLLVIAYTVISFNDASAADTIRYSEIAFKGKMAVEMDKTETTEAVLASCMNGGILLASDGTAIDCSGVKTLSKKQTDNMLAEQKKFRDNQVLPALN